MAHFYGEIMVGDKSVSRCGTKKTGMSAHIRGWEVGVEVYIHHNETTGNDEVVVYRTGGSNGRTPREIIARVE